MGMTSNIRSTSIFKYFLPQNILLVLLSGLLCLAFYWIFCLSNPPLYEAKTSLSLSHYNGSPVSVENNQKAASLLISQSIYQDVAKALAEKGFFLSQQDFYKTLVVVEGGTSIAISLTADKRDFAKALIENWVLVFKNHLEKQRNVVPNNHILEEQKQRDSAISNALNDFKLSVRDLFQTSQIGIEEQALYSKFVTAMNNRIALDSSVKALELARNNQQSALTLDFIARDPAIAPLLEKLTRLKTERAHMESQLGGEHPQVKAIVAEENAVDTEINEKADLAVKQLYLNVEMARNVENDLRDELKNARSFSVKMFDPLFSDLERKLKTTWAKYDKVVERFVSVDDAGIFVHSGAISLKEQSVFENISYRLILLCFLCLCLFWIVVSVVRQWLFVQSNADLRCKGKDISQSKQRENDVTLLKLDQVLDLLQETDARIVVVAGYHAAQVSARFGIGLQKKKKKVLLVDVSANQIENLIGPHRGFTDVLTGDADISEIIYKDYDTGIDILPQGLASTVRANDFSADIKPVVQTLKKQYDVILFAMAALPKFGFREICEMRDCSVVCPLDVSEREQWTGAFGRFDTTGEKAIYQLT